MLPIDVISTIVEYCDFVNCYNIRQICKNFYSIKQINFSNILSKLINIKMGFNKFDRFGFKLIEIIKKHNELAVGGSTIIEAINNEIYDKSDIDIYLNYHNSSNYDNIPLFNKQDVLQFSSYTDLISLFEEYKFSINDGFHTTYTVDNFFIKTIICSNGNTIQIVVNPFDHMYRATNMRDISFCNNFFDGNLLYIENLDCVINKWGTYDYSETILKNIDFTECTAPFAHVYSRAQKYYRRGFAVYIDILLCWALSDPKMYVKYGTKKDIKNIMDCFDGTNEYMSIDESNYSVTIKHTYILSKRELVLEIDKEYPRYVIVNNDENIFDDDQKSSVCDCVVDGFDDIDITNEYSISGYE